MSLRATKRSVRRRNFTGIYLNRGTRDTVRERLPVSVNFENRPLNEAFRQLAEMIEANILLDTGRAGEKAKFSVTANFRDVPAGTIVRLLADMADLKIVTVDNVLYVTTRENAKKVEEDLEKDTERLKKKIIGGDFAPAAGQKKE